MNILYIHTHDSGRFFDPYGYAVGTPAIQALAERATLFRSAFSVAPTCSPSRAGLLTGYNPHANGMLGLAHRGFGLNDYSRHVVHQLNGAGYETVLSGIQHVAKSAAQIGYRRILDEPSDRAVDESGAAGFDSVVYDRGNAHRAAEFLESRRGAASPFFLSVGLFNTHREFPPATAEVDPRYLPVPPPAADTAENRADVARFVTSARVADRCVGEVLDALDSSGLREETAVIFTTDHGVAYPDHKCTLYDTGIGVALIIDYPGNPRRGEVVDALVSHLDIYPTLCELAGLEKPPWLEGVSLRPLFDGTAAEVRDEVFAEVTFHAAYEPMRAIRTRGHKLIRRFGTPVKRPPANIDDSTSKALLVESGLTRLPVEDTQLFDLNVDPAERRNLAALPEYAPIRGELENRLNRWMEETEDPLLSGPVELPAGAYVNRDDAVSPSEPNYRYGPKRDNNEAKRTMT